MERRWYTAKEIGVYLALNPKTIYAPGGSYLSPKRRASGCG